MDNSELTHKEIYNKIHQANNILLVAHIRPDPDTISSICSMSCFLEQINKNYSPYCFDKIPYKFNFLPYSQNIYCDKEIEFKNFDLIIALDCGSLSRTGLSFEINNRDKSQYVINIDHHIKIDNFADLEIKDHNVCSTTEILYNFFKRNQIKINKDIAQCILTGILSDSGNFLFSNTTDKNISIAAEMLNHGADWFNIVSKITRNKNLSALNVWGKAISGLKINKKYNFAFTILDYNDIKNINEEELEGLPEFISTLSGVKCVIALKEKGHNYIRGNIRSNCKETDISILANVLGGGGNKKTSGFVAEGRIAQTKSGFKIQ